MGSGEPTVSDRAACIRSLCLSHIKYRAVLYSYNNFTASLDAEHSQGSLSTTHYDRSVGVMDTAKHSTHISYRHGHTVNRKRTRAYRAWDAMLARCYNVKNNRYNLYGGRGITVCERWRHSFVNFYADMGDPPHEMSLERKNTMDGYTPENCTWATRIEQANNHRNNRRIVFMGETKTVAMWERLLALPIRQRLRQGWSVESACMIPKRTTKQRTYRRDNESTL